jgi:hypothetical protein
MSRFSLAIALIALPAGVDLGAQPLTAAQAFALRQHSQCVQAMQDADGCALRTIQLASQLHGLRYGDEVAAALR